MKLDHIGNNCLLVETKKYEYEINFLKLNYFRWKPFIRSYVYTDKEIIESILDYLTRFRFEFLFFSLIIYKKSPRRMPSEKDFKWAENLLKELEERDELPE